MGVGAHVRASLGHLAALSQPIHAATATADDFPLRPSAEFLARQIAVLRRPPLNAPARSFHAGAGAARPASS